MQVDLGPINLDCEPTNQCAEALDQAVPYASQALLLSLLRLCAHGPRHPSHRGFIRSRCSRRLGRARKVMLAGGSSTFPAGMAAPRNGRNVLSSSFLGS
jgi:hypothetical protein